MNQNRVSELSYVSPEAKIAPDVEIGPFTSISAKVEIGEGCHIGPNVTIYDYVKIGRNCRIFPGAVIGAIPQDLKFEGEESYVVIGDNTTIREYVTVNRGTAASGKFVTKVGSDCLLMSYVHIAHDCCIGDHCILSGYVGLAGETDIDDWVVIGGGALVHQFTHIGTHAMIGGGNTVVKDVPPYTLAGRNPVVYEGVNSIGLKRRGFTSEEIEEIRSIYRTLYEGGMIVSEACRKIETEFPQSGIRDTVLNFVRGSKRGIMKAPR